MTQTQLLTSDETAARLRTSRTSLWKLRQAKKLRVVIIRGRIFYRSEDIQRLIDKCTYPKRFAED